MAGCFVAFKQATRKDALLVPADLKSCYSLQGFAEEWCQGSAMVGVSDHEGRASAQH